MMYDIYLYADPPSTDIILAPGGMRPYIPVRQKRAVFLAVPTTEPPVGVSLYDNLVEQYGEHDGKIVWARMLLERKGPFAEGAKYDPDRPAVAEKLTDAGLHPDAGVVKKPLRDA